MRRHKYLKKYYAINFCPMYSKTLFLSLQVFCGKIPKDIFEDELIPLFEKCGKIWDLRLMVDSVSGFSRGYCFVTFCDKEGANEAKKQVFMLFYYHYYYCSFNSLL